MSHSIIITNWKRRALLFVSSLLGAILLGGCGLLNVTHLVPTTGQVLDVSTAEPKPVADAWVRLAWGHNTICLNPVQPCSRPVCDKVEAVQTNSSGKFQVWGVPWQGLIYSLWLTEGSQNLGVLAPGYVNLYSVGKLEEKRVIDRVYVPAEGEPKYEPVRPMGHYTTRHRDGRVEEGHIENIAVMQAGYEQYAELYKKMTQRPSGQRNDIWLVPDRAITAERVKRYPEDWGGQIGCYFTIEQDVPALRSALATLVKNGASRAETQPFRRVIAQVMTVKLTDNVEPSGAVRGVSMDEINAQKALIEERAEKL
jgi:hypothetical protein